MIYVFGMSHAINVLKSVAAAPLAFTHENWASLTSDGRFFDMPTKPGLLPNDQIKVFVASPGVGWGLVADFRETPDGQRQVVAVDGYVQLLQTLGQEQDGNILVSFIHGNELSGMLVRHQVPYDFLAPESEAGDFEVNCQPVSYEVIQRQLTHTLRHTIASLTMTRILLPRMRIVHALPPPPIESEEHLFRSPEGFQDNVKIYGMTPLSIRVKYYALMTKLLLEATQRIGIEVIPHPPDSASKNGALRSEYVYGATHANEAYGALVVQQIAALVA